MTLALRYAAQTDVGLGPKTRNEDSGYAGPHLLAIADGMGGTVGGDVASTITIATVRALDVAGHAEPQRALVQATIEANARIAARIDTDPHLEGMGTTLTAVLVDAGVANVAHIGDSRFYLLRGGRLEMITKDHTFVQSLVDEGRITPEEAEHHPHRSLIMRALEGRQDARPDLIALELELGDRLLVCSDGLDNAAVKDNAIAEVLLRTATPEDAATALIALALDHGSPDNVTCVVADVVDGSKLTGPNAAGVPALVGAVAEESHTQVITETSGSPDSPPAPGAATVAAPPAEADPRDHDAGSGGGGVLAPDLEEELRYAPRPPRRFRWLTRLIGTAVVLGLLGVGARLAYDWTQSQYYIGAYPPDRGDDSRVAIFRGISQQLPGISLSKVYELKPLTLASLPPYQRERVTATIQADNLDQARSIVSMLTEIAEECAPQSDSASSPGRRTPSPTASAPTPGASRRAEGPGTATTPPSASEQNSARAPDRPLECGGAPATPQPTSGQK